MVQEVARDMIAQRLRDQVTDTYAPGGAVWDSARPAVSKVNVSKGRGVQNQWDDGTMLQQIFSVEAESREQVALDILSELGAGAGSDTDDSDEEAKEEEARAEVEVKSFIAGVGE
jgi:hypothetical protein